MNQFMLMFFVLTIIVIQMIQCHTSVVSSNSTESIITSTANSTSKPNYYKFYNESCNAIESRCYSNLECKNYKCKCSTGYIWSNSSMKCLKFSHGSCNHSIECQDYDSNMICSYEKCRCKDGYEIEIDRCIKKPLYMANHNNYCDVEYKCNSTKNLICTSYNRCKCPVGQMWSSNRNKCVKFSIGICYLNRECQDQDYNMECSRRICQCKSGYQLDYLTSKCKPFDKTIGSICSNDYECSSYVSNSRCRYGVCGCKMFYKSSSDLKTCQLAQCHHDYQCHDYDLNSECNSYSRSCQCKTGYYNSDSRCVYSYTPDDHTVYYSYYDYNILWLFFIIFFPVMGLCICCRACCGAKRTRIVNGHETSSCNGICVASGDVPIKQNLVPFSTGQLSVAQLPFDLPPKHQQENANFKY